MGRHIVGGDRVTLAHYPLGFSQARRWVKCPGSVRMQAAYPDDDSEHAREGTAAHWVLERMFDHSPVPLGTVAPNGVEITDEMLEGAQLAYDHIDMIRRNRTNASLAVEKQRHCPSIHTDNGGTPDATIAVPLELHVFDYKFGHRPIEAFENWQLINIAASFDIKPETQIHLCIIQPRAFHREGPTRTWSTTGATLIPYFARLKQAAADAMAPEAICVPSDECHHCTARVRCPALQATGYAVADLTREAVPFNLSDGEMGSELRWLSAAKRRLADRIDGLEAEIEARIRQGRSIPYWTMAPTSSPLKWTVPIEQVFALGDVLGIDLHKPAIPITPTQAKAKGVDMTMIETLAARGTGGLKLVPVDGLEARKVFSK